MDEAALKGKLCDLIRKVKPRYVVLRLEDRFTHGIPDISITGNQRQSWWEVKKASPKFTGQGIQELTMLRLARQCEAFYLVYYEVKKEQRTYIIHPTKIGIPLEDLPYEEGFNHEHVLATILQVHHDTR